GAPGPRPRAARPAGLLQGTPPPATARLGSIAGRLAAVRFAAGSLPGGQQRPGAGGARPAVRTDRLRRPRPGQGPRSRARGPQSPRAGERLGQAGLAGAPARVLSQVPALPGRPDARAAVSTRAVAAGLPA